MLSFLEKVWDMYFILKCTVPVGSVTMWCNKSSNQPFECEASEISLLCFLLLLLKAWFHLNVNPFCSFFSFSSLFFKCLERQTEILVSMSNRNLLQLIRSVLSMRTWIQNHVLLKTPGIWIYSSINCMIGDHNDQLYFTDAEKCGLWPLFKVRVSISHLYDK